MNLKLKNIMGKKAGFTLIELLVVIAIIGILAALVLVALGNARDKANDARIKASISQLRTLAEVHYDSAGATYATFGTCIATPNATNCLGGIESSVTSLSTDIGSAGGTSPPTANSVADEFCIESALNSGTSFVCVDATGITVEGAAAVCGDAGTPNAC